MWDRLSILSDRRGTAKKTDRKVGATDKLSFCHGLLVVQCAENEIVLVGVVHIA